MCGRCGFSRRAIDQFAAKMNLGLDGAIAALLAKYKRQNHAPTMQGPVVRPGTGQVELLRWGFVGIPQADGGAAPFHINARCETVHRQPAFRDSWAHRRCLVIADWFYEWDQQTKPKQPWRFVQEAEEPMVMAALWKPTTLSDGKTVDAYAVVTTEANATVGRIHDRMPVLLHQKDGDAWLDPAAPPAELKELQKPFDGPMYARPVDIRLSKASYQGDVGDIVPPAEPPQQQQLSL